MEKSKQWALNNIRDNKLLAEHYAGDATALPKLFEIYNDSILKSNFSFWNNQQDAEDAAQNQMEQMVICFNAGKYNKNTSFGAWVHTCTKFSNCNAKRNKALQEVDIDKLRDNIGEDVLFETIT